MPSMPFAASPGWVWLEVADDGDDRVAFRVEDSGPGVPEAQRERIFEPFVTSKPAGRGNRSRSEHQS